MKHSEEYIELVKCLMKKDVDKLYYSERILLLDYLADRQNLDRKMGHKVVLRAI